DTDCARAIGKGRDAVEAVWNQDVSTRLVPNEDLIRIRNSSDPGDDAVGRTAPRRANTPIVSHSYLADHTIRAGENTSGAIGASGNAGVKLVFNSDIGVGTGGWVFYAVLRHNVDAV